MAKPKTPNNADSNVEKIDTRRFVNKILGDISKTDATKQMLLGTSTGWVTGKLAIKTGKVVALLVGSGIIIVQIAHHTGYIKINWDKIFNRMDKVSDKIEEELTGSGPNWMDKVERFVDRKIDKAEEKLAVGEKKVKRWYSKFFGDDKSYKLEDINTFMLSFAAGIALGIATS